MTEHSTNGQNGVLSADAVFKALTTTNQFDFPWSEIGGRWGLGRNRRNAIFDLDAECGYESAPVILYYHTLYARGGIAARVVDLWPDESWAAYPELYERESPGRTTFERAWDELRNRVLPWHYLHRADKLSGIGHFGVILLGFDDGAPLSSPAPNIDELTGGSKSGDLKPCKLLYMRTFDEYLARVSKSEKDVFSPRYGQPLTYNINFPNPQISGPGFGNYLESQVHWTRIIHLADNRQSSEVWGVPRMRPVLNYLHDIRKVCGGSAEMFLKGGFPGYAFETYPDIAGEAAVKQSEVQKQIEEYSRGFQRYLATVGGSWKSLSVQVANPKNHIEQYVSLLCATIGVPTSIFLGREQGHLASTQDAGAWKDRLRGRQVNYLEPMVVRPFIERLMSVGVLPRVDSYNISWRDLRALSDKDRADVALKQIQALMQYVTGDVNQIVPPRLMLTMLMGFTEAQAEAIEEELVKNPPPPPVVPGPGATQGGGRKGNPNANPVGRPANTPPEGESRSLPNGSAGRRAGVHARRSGS